MDSMEKIGNNVIIEKGLVKHNTTRNLILRKIHEKKVELFKLEEYLKILDEFKVIEDGK